MVINPSVLRLMFNNSTAGEIMDVIAQCLLITHKVFKHIIDVIGILDAVLFDELTKELIG